MEKCGHKMPRYKILAKTDGNRYRFFCDLSGAAVCTVGPIRADTEEKELEDAWEEGRHFFNQCHRCGKWAANVMYNPDTLECVDCSPFEMLPHYCGKCGAHVDTEDDFCRKCGNRLMYGEEGCIK